MLQKAPLNKYYPRLLACIALFFMLTVAEHKANAAVKFYTVSPGEVTFILDQGLMKVIVCSDDIIEVKYSIFLEFLDKPSLVVNNKWGITPFTFAETKSFYSITTKKLKIIVDKANNAIVYEDLKGNVITAETQDSKSMDAATIAGISTYNVSSEFESPADEALYGLGCHPTDTLSINYKGRDQDLTIKYMTGAIPVLLSTKGYGLMWDNYSASKFYGTIDNNTKFRYVSESGKQVDYYFFYGPDFDQIINLYRTATGKAPMFPKWAFGLFQSQDRYKNQQEILSVKDGYRDNHIPVDVIVQDWFWWSPLPIGSHVMNPTDYPDPKGMIDSLHKANIRAMISVWPVFGSGTANFDALNKKGYLTSITWDNFVTKTFDTYYDAHNPKARAMYWQQAKDSVVGRYGFDAWWVDQCEPDNGSLLDARRQANFFVGKGIDYFNTYSLEHSKGIYQGWRKDIPNKRAFFLIRQSFAGEQRNAATLWSSDISTTFSALKSQVPQGINSCVSGIPYWTSDIGGYMSHTVPGGAPDWSKPEYRELFTRWFQFGTFCPIFRIHGKGERALFSKNWDEDTRATLVRFDKLRYRLMPYIYSLAGRVTADNYTIMRSLAFDFRNDPKVYNIPDQYMFGPAFLVNPVTQQLYAGADSAQGEKTRPVYLPKGTKWYDFWTGEILNGGKTIDAPAPLNILPLYVKEGSIIPFGPNIEYANQRQNDNIELRIYTGANGSFLFYEDESNNYDYEKGLSATFTLSWDDKARQLTISATKGTFPGMLKKRNFNIVLVKGKHGSNIGVTVKPDKTILYTGKAMMVKI